MTITALYAALLTVLFVLLSFRAIGQRRAVRVEIGTATREGADDMELLRRARVHANFAEYAPMALVLMGLAESLRAPPLWLHVLGLALLVGRVVHAYGLSQTPHVILLRVVGMVLTLNMLIAAAATCLWLALPGALVM